MRWPEKFGLALAFWASVIEVVFVLPVALTRTHTWFEFWWKLCRAEVMLLVLAALPAWLVAHTIHSITRRLYSPASTKI